MEKAENEKKPCKDANAKNTPVERLSTLPQLNPRTLGTKRKKSAEACGVKSEDKNKWKTIIQNASHDN